MAYNYPKVSLTIGSTRLIRHDMTDALDASETITAVTVDDITDNGSATGYLAITSVSFNALAYTPPCSQTAVAIGKAAQFSIATSYASDKVYKLKVACTTTAGVVVDYLYVSFSD